MILLTAFKPFGIVRKAMNKNASMEVLEKIRTISPENFHFAILDVSDQGISQLESAMSEASPSGVLCMGELLSLPGHQVKVEPFAIKSRPRLLPRFSFKKAESEASAFAAAVAPGNDSTIGLYYCNAAYLSALNWARKGGAPVGFVHIPVLGDRDEHANQVRKILWRMQNY